MRTLPIAIVALLASLALSSTSRSAPFEELPDGRIRHTFSGFVFPSRIGLFRRDQMQQYEKSGGDVSAGYFAGVLIAATVYVYPAPSSQEGADVLAREYGSKRGEVMHGHQGVSLLSETSASVSQGGRKYAGKRACFSFRDVFAGEPRNLKSQLFVFRDDPEFIEYRFTYPRENSQRAEEEIERFIRGWSWR